MGGNKQKKEEMFFENDFNQQIPETTVDQELINQIKEMGFNEEQAIFALQSSDNNLERAINFLLNN